MSNKKVDPKDIRDKLVHIAFSENEITEIDQYVEQAKTTRTEFIRQALFDKIRKIENPELFNNIKSKIDSEAITEFLNEIRTTTEQQREILQKLEIVNQIQNNFTLLKTLAKEPEIEENEKIIIALLHEKKALKPLKIMEITKLPSNKIYDVISNENVFSINLNGQVILKNGDQ